jgi:hypothetical protein
MAFDFTGDLLSLKTDQNIKEKLLLNITNRERTSSQLAVGGARNGEKSGI